MKYTSVKQSSGIDPQLIESHLLTQLLASMQLTPKKREQFYQHIFSELCSTLGLSENGDASVVITNINPYKRLLEDGNTKALLFLQKENLPLCGDGYIERFMPDDYRLRHSSKLHCSVYDSIVNLGNESPLFHIKTIRTLETFRKCYAETHAHHHVEGGKVIEMLRNGVLSYDNINAWAEIVLPMSTLTPILMEKSGLTAYLQTNKIEEISSDTTALKAFIGLLKNTRLQGITYANMYYESTLGLDFNDEAAWKVLANQIHQTFEVCERIEPEVSNQLCGHLLKVVSETNYGGDGYRLRNALIDQLKDFDFTGRVDATRAIAVSKYLDRKEIALLSSAKNRRSVLSEDLNL